MKILILCFFISISCLAKTWPWVHIEFAAGNYADLNVYNNPWHNFDYTVLYETLDMLVEKHGSLGIFYVNDLFEDWAVLAAAALYKYAQKQAYTKIEIRVLAGDITNGLQLPQADTAHLKNPSIGLIGKELKIPYLLKLANSSRTGLLLETYFQKELKQIFRRSTLSYTALAQVLPYGYYFPNGRKSILRNSVFLIQTEKGSTTKPSLNRLGKDIRDYDRIPSVPFRKRLCRKLFIQLFRAY